MVFYDDLELCYAEGIINTSNLPDNKEIVYKVVAALVVEDFLWDIVDRI